MTRMTIAPGSGRIEFDSRTKKLLHAAAGQRCCFRSCLRLTSGVSEANGDARERGVGVAAHIYSAADQGPRGRGGLTAEQIRSAENGLWMCALHAREVDDFQKDYPAEKLLRMKAVRELAHKLERTDDAVAFYVKEVGVLAWNECVWEHVAETPADQIPTVETSAMVKAFQLTAVRRIAVFGQYDLTLQAKLPEQFAVKPVATAVKAMGPALQQQAAERLVPGMNDKPSRNRRRGREHLMARDVVEILRKLHPQARSDPYAFSINGEVFLTVADPETGARYEGGVWQRAWLYGGVHHSPEGEVEFLLSVRSFDPVSPFTWNLRVERSSTGCSIHNALGNKRLPIPYLSDPMRWGEFLRYRELLAKIVAGWKPLVYVSGRQYEQELHHETAFHSEPFEPEVAITEAELATHQRDCAKVSAAMNVATRWAQYWGRADSPPTRFVFNELFFADDIDADVISYACDLLIAACLRNRSNPFGWRTEPLVMTGRRNGIVFQFSEGALAFRNIVNVRSVPS